MKTALTAIAIVAISLGAFSALADEKNEKIITAQNEALRKELQAFKSQCCPTGQTTCTMTMTCQTWAPALQARAGGTGISVALRKEIELTTRAKYKAVIDLALIHNGKSPNAKAGAISIDLGMRDDNGDASTKCPEGMYSVKVEANHGVLEAKDSGEPEGHTSAQVYTCKDGVINRAKAAAILAGINNPPPAPVPAPAIIAPPIPEEKRSTGGWLAATLGGGVLGGGLGFGLVYGLGPKDEVFQVADGTYKHERNGELIVGTTIASFAVGAGIGALSYYLGTR